jgi:hypothetical protein
MWIAGFLDRTANIEHINATLDETVRIIRRHATIPADF